jgi:phosphomannomutase
VLVLEMLGREGRRFSELLAPLRAKYFISGEINSRVKDVEAVLARIEAKHRDAEITKIDGISVDYPDWHFNVRASNTEPLVRLNLEAYSKPDMERHRDEVLALIRQ